MHFSYLVCNYVIIFPVYSTEPRTLLWIHQANLWSPLLPLMEAKARSGKCSISLGVAVEWACTILMRSGKCIFFLTCINFCLTNYLVICALKNDWAAILDEDFTEMLGRWFLNGFCCNRNTRFKILSFSYVSVIHSIDMALALPNV